MHIHIDQGVNFSKLAKNIKIQKLGKLLLAHFGCILAHCATAWLQFSFLGHTVHSYLVSFLCCHIYLYDSKYTF